ncbi:carbohydrate-binding protein [Microbacterium sp. SA39]|uniref:carbohydrate-binding protein n=1 Tax=Microbacterium sp. SA39 TaxID=1263625 RepID=UPI0005F9B61E|nr:carbohydrate-binding protein [Microbacterium sp. SA39]KJQ52663.1 Carbohydrate binding domain protein [Microbacterium sp. SA39]
MKIRRRSIRRTIGALTAGVIALSGALLAAPPATAASKPAPPAAGAPLAAAMQAPLPEIVPTVSDAGFAHPGIGFTADNLENMRTQVRAGVDPWASYYDAMVDTRYASLDFRAENAQPGTDTPKNDAYASAAMRTSALKDGIGAMTQALQYAVTGDEQYRANALHVIRTWSGLDPAKYAYFPDAHIHTGVPLYYMLIAAELIRSTDPVNDTLDGYDLRWTDADEQRIEDNLVRPVLETFLSSKNRLWNQHLYGVIGMISPAIFLDDADLYAERVEWFTVNAGYESEHDLYGGNVNGSLAQLFREIPADDPANTTGAPFVQHMEMLRDQAHGQGDVDIFIALARIVDAQGTKLDPVDGTVSDAEDAVSPYGFLDNRILEGADTFYAFMMGEEVPFVPANEGGALSQAYRGRLQDPLSEAYLQYRYVADVDVDEAAPYVAELYEQRDGPLYYYGSGVQNFWNDRGSDYTGAEYWVAFPEELAEVDDTVAPLAPSAELSVRTFGSPLGDGAVRDEADGTSFIRLDADADDARLAIRRAIWGDRASQSLVGVKVRSDGSARLEASRTAAEAPFAEIVVPDTGGEWRYVWFDLALAKTPGAVGENILFLRATGSDAKVDVAGLLAQANGVLTPPVFADTPSLDAVLVAGEPWTRQIQTTDAAGETVTLALQGAPSGAALNNAELSWSPGQSGESEMTVVASDGTTVTALPVTITVAESREAAIDELVGRAGEGAEYTSVSWGRFEEARAAAVDGAGTADAPAFATLLRSLGDAVSGLVALSPELPDGTLDYRSLVIAPPLTAAQLTAITDGDNQTTWGDQRVPSIVFDFGASFRVSAERFGFQARDTFTNRAEGTNVYGSEDGVTWTLLTENPNTGTDAAIEWIPVRSEVRDSTFRFLKLQVDEPGVPSDPAYPGIWSIADLRIDGTRSEAVGTMDTVAIGSGDAVAGRVVAGDTVELTITGPAGNTDVAVTVAGLPATVSSPSAGKWTATATLPAGAAPAGRIGFTLDFATADGRAADTIHATTDGSKLFLSSDSGRIDSAFRDATVLRPDGVADAAWTQYTARMLDGNAATHSDTRLNSGLYGNMWDFGPDTTVSLTAAELLVRQDGFGTSRIADMRLEGSNDLATWTRLTPQAPAKTLDWQAWTVQDDTAYRYIRLVNGQILNVAELILFGAVTTASAVPAWDPTAVYDAGDQVSYGDSIYTAQWWTSTVAPDSSSTGSWMEQGALVPDAGDGVRAWTSSFVYTGGEVVALDGRTFRAKWWTRNQEPRSANGPWQDLGAY